MLENETQKDAEAGATGDEGVEKIKENEAGKKDDTNTNTNTDENKDDKGDTGSGTVHQDSPVIPKPNSDSDIVDPRKLRKERFKRKQEAQSA